MNSSKEDLPKGYAEALARLRQDGSRINYRSMSYLLVGVKVLHVTSRQRPQRIKNPARQNSLWGWLTAEKYVWTTVPDLGELYADSKIVGRLHGGSEDMARAVAPILASGPQDLVISGHFTESGWYVDSVSVAT